MKWHFVIHSALALVKCQLKFMDNKNHNKIYWSLFYFKQRYRHVPLVHSQVLIMQKRNSYCHKWSITCDNGNIQSGDQEESKLSSTIIVNRSVHAHKIVISPFNKYNLVTIKSKKNQAKILLLGFAN